MATKVKSKVAFLVIENGDEKEMASGDFDNVSVVGFGFTPQEAVDDADTNIEFDENCSENFKVVKFSVEVVGHPNKEGPKFVAE